MFVNTEWNNIYPKASVTNLERAHSNHSTIVLRLNHEAGVQFPRPFRFQPMWLSNPSFPRVVRETWSASNSLDATMTNFEAKAKEWNKNHFGNIFHRKRRLGARLKGIQSTLTNRPSSSLIEIERGLRAEYSEVLCLKEEFWSMKSRITWIIDGDRNTAFSHTSALIRRRRNKITCIKDRMGNWLNGDFVIAEFIRQGFIDLFSSSQVSVPIEDWIPPCWQCRLVMRIKAN